MCGINGIFFYRATPDPEQECELLTVRDSMKNRGPDACGLWVSHDSVIGLAHRRLSILDLSDLGRQPMFSQDGRFVIVFNGEIYNYKELRANLQQKGLTFRSDSDTEVLLRMYEQYRSGMISRLRGMYAFAVWDCARKELFLARDSFGIKPLYYSDSRGVFRFASQVKALIAGGHVDSSPEPAGHVGFFLFGSVPEPYTLYRGIRALPPGATVTLRLGQTPCFERRNGACEKGGGILTAGAHLEVVDALHEAMLDTISRHLVADVPVSVFLSAGLDSSTLAVLATEAKTSEVHTVTLGFEEYKGTEKDEVPAAENLAARLGTQHRTCWVRASDFAEESNRILEAMDQPSIDGVNSYFVSKVTAACGFKVALSGAGGDELFAGYDSFQRVPRVVRLFRPVSSASLGRWLRRVSSPLISRVASPKLAGLAEYGGTFGGAYLLVRGLFMPWELHQVLDRDIVSMGLDELRPVERLNDLADRFVSPLEKVQALEQNYYLRNQLLRDADWAGMWHSLEIRVPLVDLQLQQAVLRLRAAGLVVDKKAMARTTRGRISEEWLSRRKTGFNIPVQDWCAPASPDRVRRRGLRGWAEIVHRAHCHTGSLGSL